MGNISDPDPMEPIGIRIRQNYLDPSDPDPQHCFHQVAHSSEFLQEKPLLFLNLCFIKEKMNTLAKKVHMWRMYLMTHEIIGLDNENI